MKTNQQQINNEIKRMDAFTDGVFGIVATLLTLDIKLPDIPANHSNMQLVISLKEVIPSMIAFAFSFLTIIIYWINHDHISKWMKNYNQHVKYMNLLLLFFICLIPFPTKFISEYPHEQIAVMTYGIIMLMVAVTAYLMYYYIAFKSDLLYESVSQPTRKKFAYKIMGGPLLYSIAVLASFISVYISIGFYIVIPLLYVILPKAELNE